MGTHQTILLAVDDADVEPPPLDDWSVETVRSVPAALDRLSSTTVDCVVSAQELRNGTGLDLLAAVRDGADLPFVLWPADGGDALANRAVAMGVDAYVARDVDAGECLRAGIERTMATGDDHDGSTAPAIAPRSGVLTAVEDAPDDAHSSVPGTDGWSGSVDRWETVIEAVEDVIWTADSEGRITYVNTTNDHVYGVPVEDVLGNRIVDVVDDIEARDPSACSALTSEIRALLAGDREHLRRRVTLVADDGDLTLDVHVVPLVADGDVVGAAGVNHDVTDLKRHERRITALHATARRLLEAESRAEIAGMTVEAAEDVLDLPGVVVYLYDGDANELVPAAYTGEKDRLYGRLPPVQPDEGITGRAFLSEETTVHEDVHESEHMLNDAAAIRSGLFIPLDEHGVLIAGDTAADAFDRQDVERAELLAANAEAALDRTRRDDTLAAQGRALEEQNRRLERLNDVNECIRRVLQAVVRTETREEIEQGVCEQLVASGRFAFAWVGDAADGELQARARVGEGGDYLDRLVADGMDADEPAARAAGEGEAATVRNVGEDPTSSRWRREALREDLRSVVAIPLEYGQVDYGVLAIYADTTDAFDDLTRTVLEELATTVAYAINAVEQRSALLSEHRFEAEFRVGGVADDLAALSRTVGGDLTVQHVTPRGDGTYNVYGTVPAEATDEMEGVSDDLSCVHRSEVVEAGSPASVRVVVDDPDVWERVSDMAGRPERITIADDGTTTVTVTLPRSTVLSDYAERLSSYFDDATLVARRQSPVTTRESLDEHVGLTDRQREVLEAAYHSGFFEWPRSSTGEEIAAALDISQPAFLDHLRVSERKLVDVFLGPPSEN